MIQKSTKLLGQPLFSKIVLILSISWWKCSKFEQSLNALCNNVNSKLFIWLRDETFKFGKNSAKRRFAANWNHKFVIVPCYFDVKRFGIFPKWFVIGNLPMIKVVIVLLLSFLYKRYAKVPLFNTSFFIPNTSSS